MRNFLKQIIRALKRSLSFEISLSNLPEMYRNAHDCNLASLTLHQDTLQLPASPPLPGACSSKGP